MAASEADLHSNLGYVRQIVRQIRGKIMADHDYEQPHASMPFEREIIEIFIRSQSPRSIYLEIGSSTGASLAWYGRMCDLGGKLLAVDRAMPTKNGTTNRKTLKRIILDLCERKYNASLIDGDSTDPATIADVRQALGPDKVDILLIDGGHAGHIVYQDVRNYVPFVRRGGLVIMHDVGPCPFPGVVNPGTILLGRDCFEAWRGLASRHQRKLLVQEGAGYGLVWLND